MTQLLLFDAPASAAFPVPATAAEQTPQPPTRRAVATQGRQRGNAEKEMEPPRGGMHRMGDLANLVIARYELVAKRRAALLARGPLPSVRF